MFEITIAKAQDFDEIYSMYTRVCKELETSPFSPHWEIDVYPNREDITGLINRDEMIICKKNNKIVGAVAVYNGSLESESTEPLEDGEPGENESGIRLFAVHPEFRGIGVSNAMLDYAKTLTRSRGHKALVLTVAIGNSPAENLYRRNGFAFLRETLLYFHSAEGDPYYVCRYEV